MIENLFTHDIRGTYNICGTNTRIIKEIESKIDRFLLSLEVPNNVRIYDKKSEYHFHDREYLGNQFEKEHDPSPHQS